MIQEASYKLPEGHKSVAVYTSEEEARYAGNLLLQRAPKDVRYYMMDKRGAWEIIRYRT